MNVRKEAKQLRRMLMIGEAAELCGVTTETLRNWDRSGRLVPNRHPITGYRYYRREEIEAFIEKVIAEREAAV